MHNSDTSPTPFAILVHGDPLQSKSHLSAQKFITAIYQSSKKISRVFFYGDATSICGNFHTQNQLRHDWLALAKKYNFPLQACVTTAINRGVIDALQSEDTVQPINLVKGFELEGLGMLAEAISTSNK